MGTKSDIIVITTYNRQAEVKELVRNLRKIFEGEIIVFDDGSSPPANPECERYHLQHRGKRYYYELVSFIFQNLRSRKFRYFYMLPDDIIPDKDLFTDSVKLWQSLKDERKICLSVGHTFDRHYEPCWTYFQPVRMGEIVLTGWNDLCFMAERNFLQELNYEIEQPLANYDYRSSGVGRYISRTLYAEKWNMYHTDKSYCEFPANETRMHLEKVKT